MEIPRPLGLGSPHLVPLGAPPFNPRVDNVQPVLCTSQPDRTRMGNLSQSPEEMRRLAHSVSADAPTGSGSAAPTPISTSGSRGVSAGAWAASARWGEVGSPIVVGQM